jgi:outer membrane protein assembly factor BamB
MINNRFLLLLFCWSGFSLGAQNWATLGGNNQRNSYSRMIGPDAPGAAAWTVTSSKYTAWGNTVLVQGDRFVNTRTQITPAYVGQVECRSLSDGALLWTTSIAGAKLYAVGFDEYAVFVHNYSDNTFFALDPANGALRWEHPEPVPMFGGTAGILFACNGDPVVVGKRIDRYTGTTVWENNYIFPVSPDAGYASFGNTYYHWEGTILTPKKLIALDMETGALKYMSTALPGDGDQEWPLCVGPDGTIYITRDGGFLYAFEDFGSGLFQKWSSAAAPESRISIGPDGSLYYYRGERILRANPSDGTVLDTSAISIATSFQPLITVDADGLVYVNNAGYANAGKYYCLSADLQTVLWQINTPTNYYAAVAPGREGTVVVCGEGYQIKAYRYHGTHKPVANFVAEKTLLQAGEPISFNDQSSFGPNSWQWQFPGSNTPFSNAQHPSGIVYPAEGVYEVTLIAGNNLGADTLVRNCYIHVSGMVDAHEVKSGVSMLKIYPQPTSDWLNIEAPSGSWLRISRLVSGDFFFEGELKSTSLKLPVNDWPAGPYLLEIFMPDGKRQIEKIVLAR